MLVQLTVTTCTNFAGRLSLKMLGKEKAEGKRRRKIILVTEVSCRKCQSAAGSQQSGFRAIPHAVFPAMPRPTRRPGSLLDLCSPPAAIHLCASGCAVHQRC